MKKNIIKRKNKILIEAIDLLDESGIQGLTTKEIAKRQGITEPAIYKQFESKKHIILSIIDQYAKYDETIRGTVLQQGMCFEEKIIYYVNAYTEYYESYPQITVLMFSADIYRYDPDTFTQMKEIIQDREAFLMDIVAKAQEDGEVIKTCDPEEIADAVHAAICWYIYKWRVLGADVALKKSLQERMRTLLENISTSNPTKNSLL